MQEALKQVSELCPDATHKSVTISLNVDDDESMSGGNFAIWVNKRGSRDEAYSYSCAGSCWHEAIDELRKKVQGAVDLKETVAETDRAQR